MGKNIFLPVLTLVIGVSLGVIGMLAFQPEEMGRTEDALYAPPILSAPAPLQSAAPSQEDPTESVRAFDPEDNRLLLDRAFSVLTALEEQDYAALAGLIHPENGVVFTPYSTVDLTANLCFTADQVAAFGKDGTRYVWGLSDGKGDPLEMTAGEYFARYVYNADYAHAPMIGLDRVIGSGNALENVAEVFPEGRFVEFYFPGLRPEYNGFDWCGLKLVFTQYREEYRLSAIVHSEWTI